MAPLADRRTERIFSNMASVKFRRVSSCIFCGRPARSAEDAWPLWVIRKVRRDGTQIIGQVDGEQLVHDPHRKTVRVKCVCKVCNNGWMSRLESRVMPIAGAMMADFQVPLDRGTQAGLALWAVKTAMVFEHTSKSKTIYFTDQDRQMLATRQSLPSGTYVFIGRYAGRLDLASWGADAGPFDPNGPNLDAFVFTMIAGRLSIQVVSMRRAVGESRDSFVQRRSDFQWENAALHIWPVERAIEWPPRVSSDDDAVTPRDFHRSWDPTDRILGRVGLLEGIIVPGPSR